MYINSISLFLVLTASITITKGQVNCPPNFVEFNKSCYRFVVGDAIYGDLSWFEAQRYCTYYVQDKYVCHLVNIETIEEQLYLMDTIRNDNNLSPRDFWIGLSNNDKLRTWLWTSKQTSMSYIGWNPGYPEGNGNCAAIWSAGSQQWVDEDCRRRLSFICELELE